MSWFSPKVVADRHGHIYFRKWTLLSMFGRRVCLHQFLRPDASPDFHDHRWAFVSLILWGGYEEEYLDALQVKTRINKPLHIVYGHKNLQHRLRRLLNGTCWTLCFIGKPIRNEWGYWTLLKPGQCASFTSQEKYHWEAFTKQEGGIK